MPSQSPQQPDIRFASRVLTMPESGMRQIMLTPGRHLEFSFDPAGVTFSRSGTDLVISAGNGSGVTLSGFFIAENADALPQFVFPGGDSVPASAYLQSLNIDITTAAGPVPSAPPSGGEGEYSDGAGDLLGGVDRLGSLGTDQWAGTLKAAETPVAVARGLDAGGPDAGPDVRPTPVEPPIFNARAVLYMQNEGEAPNGQPYGGRGVTVQALAKDGNGQWEASGQEAASIQAHEGNTLDVDSLLEYTTDGNGNITFRLTAAGKAWMNANGKDMVAYYTITDADGNPYVIQVVISADGTFNSSSEHNANLDPNGLAHGEWHNGKDMSKETDYKTTSSNLSDELRYTGALAGAEIATGHAVDKNWGNDSVTIEGSVRRSAITSGAGNDSIVITGSSEYDRSIGGEYAGGTFAAGMRSKEEAGGATVWGGTIDAGDGNNTIRISGGAMYGIMETAITTGSGDDLIEIRGGNTHDRMDVNGWERYFGGNAVKDSVIDAGDGNNTITITSDYPFNPNVTGNDTIGGYSMAAVNNSKIITGSGDDSITINAATVTYNAPYEFICDNALYATTIAAGAGNDTVTVNGNVNWGSVIALGKTTDRADADQGQKNDVNILNLNSNEVWNSAIYGTAGKDIINAAGARFAKMTVATGAGSDSIITGDLNQSTIALGNTLTGADTDASQKDDVNTLKAVEVLRSSIYGTAGTDEITVGGVSASTIVTGAGGDKVHALHLDGSTIALGNTTNKADTDADQANDVNTLNVGGPGTEFVGAVVQNGKVYGTAGMDLLSIHGGVTGSIIDTGAGAGDTVDIRGSVFSTDASDKNMIKAVDGSVSVTMKGSGTIAAVSASGTNAHNSIISADVEITAGDDAMSAANAYGLYAKGADAANDVGGGDLTVSAKGQNAYGVSARDADASNTVNMAGDAVITATGTNAANGVAATGGGAVNGITAVGNVTITATGAPAPGMSNFDPLGRGGIGVVGNGTHDNLARNELTSLTGDLKISGSNYGVYNQYADNVLQALRGNVEITGGSYGVVWRESHWGTPPTEETELSISAGTDVIIKGQRGLVLTDAARYGGDVHASQQSAATVHAGRNLTITAEGGADGGIGIEYLQSGLGKSLELSADRNVGIEATGNRVARGIYSYSNSGDKASISVDAGHDLNISARTKGGTAGYFRDFQMSQAVSNEEGAVGAMLFSATTNTFKAGHNLTIGARDESNTSSCAVQNSGTKAFFEAGETATFEAEGGKNSHGLSTFGGGAGSMGQGPSHGATTVTAKTVRVSASGTEAAYGVRTRGVDNNDISSGESRPYGSVATEVHATGTAIVTAQSAGSAHALYTQSGSASDNPTHRGASASTKVTGKDVLLTATGGKQAFGVYTEAQRAEAATSIVAKESVTVTATGDKAWGVFAKGDGASNTLKSDARLSVAAEGVKLAQGVTAQGDGALSELSSLVRMDITAKATGPGSDQNASSPVKEGAVGLYAADGGKVTAETKDLHITASTTGEQWAAGARADGGGHIELTGRDIAVRAEANAVNRSGAFAVRAAALHTTKGDITVNMTGHSRNTLLLEAENRLQAGSAGGNDFAAGILAEGASNVSITGDKNATHTITIKTVSGAGASAGIYTLGKDSDVSILGGDNFDDISINAASNTGMAMGIHVSKDTSDVLVDTGKGGDLVTIRARSSATSDSTVSHAYGLDNAGGTITVKAVEGSVDIGTFSNKSGSEAMSAAGSTAVNTVEAGRVALKAESDGGISIGVHAQRSAANHVSASENVTIETKGRMAHGMYAEAGGVNAVTAKAVDISATGTKTTHNHVNDRSAGLNAVGSGSSNTVSAREDVTVTVTDVTAHGLYAEEGGANSVAAKNIGISATGSNDVGSLQERTTGLNATGNGSSNTVSASENVTITTAGEICHSIHASGAGASNTVRAGGALGITATSADGNAYGVAAEKGGANTLTGADVDITVQAKHSAHGMNAQDGGTNVVTSESRVDITADGRIVRVLNAGDGGRNEISAATDVTIDGDCRSWGRVGAATGIHGEDGGSNTVTAGGDVEISAKGGESAIGMRYKGSAGAGGVNRISAKGDVRITASDAFSEEVGMMAKDFGGNEICGAQSVAIEVGSRESSRKSFAMYAYGDKITGAVGAFNSIHDVAGAVTLIAKNGSAIPEASDSGTAGMMAYNGGKNSIFNAESVDIQVEGYSLDGGGYGMKACGSAGQVSQEMNHIHDIAGKVALEVTGSTPSYGMYASDSGTNLIENTGGVEIAATGDLYSYAMYAKDGGINTISNNNGNALIVVIKATGGSLGSYAMFAAGDGTNRILGGDGNDVISLQGDMYAEGTGKNIIDTGAGDDRIQLDGKVSGDFQLDAGDGYDILVLRAASWSQFTARYRDWLTANFDTLNIESIQWALNNPAGSVPAWLQDLVNNYNAQHSDAPIDFSQAAAADLAHIVAGDVSNIIDHDGDVTTAHTAQYAGDGHGPAVFGDGDDYVHVKGNVNHVDFTLGGGHNILHVDGNAQSHISGGDNGNDIRVGGLFNGGIDLGSSNDYVDLGALHGGNILLGAGNDNLALSAFTGGTVDGGAGYDILTLNLGGHGGNSAFAADGAFGGLFTPGAVQNFEELRFDLSGGGGDSLEVEGLIDSLRGLTGGAQTTVRITGDAGGDHVDTQTLANNGWTSSIDSASGYTRWAHADSEDENLIILIQNGLR